VIQQTNLLTIVSTPLTCDKTIGIHPDERYTRSVEIDFEIGAETIDYVKLAEKEKLKPMEVELRKLEDMVKEILENMEHLQAREETMRNTNGKARHILPPF